MEAATSPPCGHRGSARHLYDGEDRLCGIPGRFSVVRCASCGLGGTVPRLSPEALEAYYPETYPSFQEAPPRTTTRERVGARIDAARFSTAMRIGAFRQLTRSRPGRLLDVGCGRGDVAAWFAARGWEVAGVEPGDDAARLAADRGIETHHGTLDDAPWAPSSFDAVTFNHSLEHVPDPSLALRQAAALLRPGGLVTVSVPNFGGWQRRLFRSRWFHLDLPRHLQHFDRASLSYMTSAAGLEPQEVRTTSSLLGFLASVQYALRGRLFLSDVTMHRAMHLLYPFVLLADLLFREADCLHVVARRACRGPGAAVQEPTRLPAMLGVSARARERVRLLAARAGVESQLRSAYHLVNRTARREARDNEHMRVLLAGSLAPDASCIDIGAHDGGVLREIVRCAPQGRHIAYEPLPELAAALARDYPQVDVRAAALSDHDGKASFLHDRTQPMRSTLHAHAFTDHGNTTAITVRVERLDGVLPSGYVPTLVKIDVEGTEAEVLRGAVETLRRHRPVVVFEHGAGGTSSPAEVYSLLVDDAGYRIFDLDGTGPYSLAEFEATYPRPTMWNWIARP